MNISGKWKGYFTQQFESEEKPYSAEFDFEMNLIENEHGFEGTCFDIEIEIGSKEKSEIKGFVQNGMISFIKQYQNTISYDSKTDELVLEKGIKPVEINYYGNWDKDSNKFSGTWEVVAEEEKESDDYIEKVEYGYWEMAKIEE